MVTDPSPTTWRRLSGKPTSGPLPRAKWCPRELLADLVANELTLEEVGAYFVLLALQDANDGLPVDLGELRALITGPVDPYGLLKVVLLYFPESEDGQRRRNAAFDQQRAHALWVHAQKSAGGRLTAAKRWPGKNGSSASSTASGGADRRGDGLRETGT